MRLWGWMLAAVLVGAGATAATAYPERVRVVEKTRTYYEDDRKWDGGDRKWEGSDRKWDGGDRKWDGSYRKWDNSRRKWGWRTECRTRWRYGRRERDCRRYRYR